MNVEELKAYMLTDEYQQKLEEHMEKNSQMLTYQIAEVVKGLQALGYDATLEDGGIKCDDDFDGNYDDNVIKLLCNGQTKQ